MLIIGEIGRGIYSNLGLPRWLSGKEATCNAGDLGSFSGSGRSPGGGQGNPLQHSCLENPRDRGALQAAVHDVPTSRARLSAHTAMHRYINLSIIGTTFL